MADEAAKPTARLVVVREYCTRAAGADCARCVAACPHGAVRLPEGDAACAPVVDHAACNGCGVCFGICDAFAPVRLTTNDLHARIRRIAISGQRAYLTCRQNMAEGMEPAANVVVLPCLSMVPPQLWTLMMAENIRLAVACNLRYCEDCERAGNVGGQLFPRAIELAQQHTGGNVLYRMRVPQKRTMAQEFAEGSAKGRRDVFVDFATDVGQIASGKRRLQNSTVLQDFYERRERQRASARLNLADDGTAAAFAPEGRTKRVMFPRQRMTVEAVSRMPEAAKHIEVAVSCTEEPLCQGSGACVDACPTGARQRRDAAIDAAAPAHAHAPQLSEARDDLACEGVDTGGGAGAGDPTATAVDLSPTFDPCLCVGCGICVDACPHGACSVQAADARVYLPYVQEHSQASPQESEDA